MHPQTKGTGGARASNAMLTSRQVPLFPHLRNHASLTRSTHLDHHATRCVAVEAEGLGSSALQDGGRRRLEARFRDARMVLLEV